MIMVLKSSFVMYSASIITRTISEKFVKGNSLNRMDGSIFQMQICNHFGTVLIRFTVFLLIFISATICFTTLVSCNHIFLCADIEVL